MSVYRFCFLGAHESNSELKAFGEFYSCTGCYSSHCFIRSRQKDADSWCFLGKHEMGSGTTVVAIECDHSCSECYKERLAARTAYVSGVEAQLHAKYAAAKKAQDRAKARRWCANNHAMSPMTPAVFENDAYTCVDCWNAKHSSDEPNPEPKKAKADETV